MDIYGIPERYNESLRSLLLLSDADIGRVCTQLSQLPYQLFPGGDVAKKVAEVLSISAEEASERAELLLSLYFRLSKSSQDVRAAATNIVDAFIGVGERPDVQTREKWITNLVALLSIETLYVLSNASGLLYERSNLFTGARILTDIRPVFPRDLVVGKPPSAFLVTHTLRITYSNARGEEDVFVAMDAEDLSKMSDQIERAQTKEKQLKSVIGTTKIPIIESDGTG